MGQAKDKHSSLFSHGRRKKVLKTLGVNVTNNMFIANSGMDQGKDKRSSLLSQRRREIF